MSLAAVIAAQRDQHGIPHAVSCRALGVSQAWFYKWRPGVLPQRAARRAALAAEVARLFAAHRGTYGSPRITADLKDAGWKVSENTVAQLMAELRLAARRKKKRRSLTRPGKGRWRAPDLVRRDFSAGKVNKKWFGDGTEIRTAEGKLYLASVLDVGSRRILGFALSKHHDAGLAYGALAMAIFSRKDQIDDRLVHHSDRGVPSLPSFISITSVPAIWPPLRSKIVTVPGSSAPESVMYQSWQMITGVPGLPRPA